MNRFSALHLSLWAIWLLVFAANVPAANTDLSTTPLVTATPQTTPPNIFLMMDDSGSMSWTYMPDVVNDFSIVHDSNGNVILSISDGKIQPKYGYTSSQCNGVYYNPAITYTPPVDYTGTAYPDASFTAAQYDGFNPAAVVLDISTEGTKNGKVDLSTIFRSDMFVPFLANTVYQTYGSLNDTPQAAYYYTYSGTQTSAAQKNYYDTNSVFYKECNSLVGSTTQVDGAHPVNTLFTKVTVSATSGPPGRTDERQNFANWFSYYRTRINMMKSAAGLAFSGLDSNYRVGFATMNNHNNTGHDFVNLATFDSAGKSAWYAKLYGTTANQGTPLLRALSDVGLMYAGKLSTLSTLYGVTVYDPIQYSCQQNFAILSTDGFWNVQTNQTLTAGPSNTAVGNQDGTEPRPMFDGLAITTDQQTQTQTQTMRTRTRLQKSTVQVQSSTSALQQSTALLQQRTYNTKTKSWGTYTEATPCTWSSTTNCRYLSWSSYATASSCTTVNLSTGTTNGTIWTGDGSRCQYAAWTNYANASSCLAVPKSTASPYTGPAMQCRDLTSAWANANATSCDPGTSGGLTTSCRQVPYDGPTAVDSCTPGTSSDGVTTTCQTNTSGPTPVQSCTADSPDSSNHWTTTTCTGTSNTLADVAEYYYKTDLRDSSLSPTSCDGALVGTDVCQNNVPTVGRDSASWQHMTTFTLGLGARGRMVFSPTYLTDVSGDYYSVKNGVPYNPSTPSICSWQTSGACNWPTPDVLGTPENIDDVWHAAVNGRGTYFSATDPASLATGLSSTLNSLKTITGSSAAATTSNPNVAMGDNYVFSSFFTTVDWTGELIRQQIDTTTGVLPIYNETDTATYDWSARDRLDANTSRTIYTYNTSTHSLQAFTSANFASSPYFNTPNIASLTQFCTNGAATCLDSVSQASPSQADAAGANLVNYLRGDRSHEGTVNDPGTPTAYYRQRTHILGDIVDSEAVYVRGSLNQYADAGYSLFVTANATRQPMVYVGANDGMLHAFYAADGSSGIVGGNEAWGYIPSLVLPNLYKLADENYTNHHQFYVDSTPTVSDICFSQCSEAANAVWKTILVGGLNAGGRGYYALDITNPSSPNVLWEFTDSNLGYTYGNPIITKLNDGTWVVLVASGYNNVVPGDGQGRLYVLNATTGAIIHQMSNGVGDATTPSGLARINAWVNNAAVDNTSLRVYGGDLQGNLWRFDLNATTGSYDAQLLVTLKDAAGNAQPITAKPELGKVSGTAVVYVGTGKFLGTTDLVNTSQQSFYAVKDTLAIQGTAIWGNPHNFTCSTTRTTSCFVQQTVTNATCPSGSSACSSGQAVRTSTNNVMDFGTNSGWYVDLANNGERTNTDPTLALGSLVFTANTPSVSSCTVGGYSYIYILNYLTGAAGIATANTTSGATTASNAVAAVMLGNVFATRSTVVELPNYTLVGITRLSNGTTVTTNIPPLDSSGPLRRISWHELF